MNGKKDDGFLLLPVGHRQEITEKERDSKASRNVPPDNRAFLKYGSLFVLTIQNCSLNLLMRMSRTQKDLYITSTAVVVSEVMKLLTCIFMVFVEQGSVLKTWQTMNELIIQKPIDTFKVAVPSIVYYIQNNLIFVGATHLDAATCQITYQLKILTTAIFSVVMLRKRLFPHQWLALVLLFAGVALVQAQQVSGKTSSNNNVQKPFIGFMAILIACFLSGFAGVYFEKILKGTAEVSLWIRNVQMSSLSIVFGVLAILFTDLSVIEEKGFFFGYTLLTWTVIILQAGGGLICAVVVKYADNILKGFATSLAIVLSCVVSAYYLDFHPTGQFMSGAFLVIFSVFLYAKQFSPKSSGNPC
ncbi:UDP-N-acetylglucosamine transporter-like [Brevipalpus obovatus]|uniref:UDP-N-acetylglucosamine transporter-like n=1 Tax=Brevipalpus obovatus TaxID=246614 RepID=UPI003D9E91D3